MGWSVRKFIKCPICFKMTTLCDAKGKFCSAKCRQQAYRDRKKIKRLVDRDMEGMSRAAIARTEALRQELLP